MIILHATGQRRCKHQHHAIMTQYLRLLTQKRQHMGDTEVHDATGLDGMMSRCVPFRTSRCGRRVPTRGISAHAGARPVRECPALAVNLYNK